ncbi:MAG: extracellular solute-binding protein [Campylobacterota bacterium]|nr:extracellular solute-binding protein [Campylobacterota bacterium]
MKGKILLAISMLVLTYGELLAKERLKIITWKGYAPKALVKKFEKETGIRVKITYSNNEEMIAKLRATRGAGFDIAQPSQDRISFAQKQFPIYQPIDYSKVNTEQLVPSMLASVKKNSMVDGKSYAVPFCYGTTGLVVNKKEAPEVDDWSDLWNPKYEGKISYRLKRPMLIATAFGMGEDPFALYGDIEAYKKLMARVEKKLIETKSYVKNYWTSGDTQVNIIKSGDANVISGWDGKGWEVHKVNPNIDYVAPKSGALGWIDTFAIPAKAKNIEAAYRWINFMLSAKNAAYFTNKEKYGTASKGAEAFLNEEVKSDFKRAFTPEDIENIKWQPPVPSGFEAIESEVLDRIKAAK